MTYFFSAFNKIGGYNAVLEEYKHAATNYTLQNQTFYSCGMPREDAFRIFRNPLTADIPWTGATLGLTFLALSVWCQDQVSGTLCHSFSSSSFVFFVFLYSFWLRQCFTLRKYSYSQILKILQQKTKENFQKKF